MTELDYENLDKIPPVDPDHDFMAEIAEPVDDVPELPDETDETGAYSEGDAV